MCGPPCVAVWSCPVLQVTTAIKPQDNSLLEGLYKSGGNYCTQVSEFGYVCGCVSAASWVACTWCAGYVCVFGGGGAMWRVSHRCWCGGSVCFCCKDLMCVALLSLLVMLIDTLCPTHLVSHTLSHTLCFTHTCLTHFHHCCHTFCYTCSVRLRASVASPTSWTGQVCGGGHCGATAPREVGGVGCGGTPGGHKGVCRSCAHRLGGLRKGGGQGHVSGQGPRGGAWGGGLSTRGGHRG